MITLEHVSKTYGSKRKKAQQFQALKDVSLTIEDGASVAIVGKSGSGKSTLMHVMSGLDRTITGTVTVDGVEISTLSQKAIDKFRAKKIGFIFQSFFVQAHETCVQNVALPLEINNITGKKRRQRIQTALEAVELTDKSNQAAGNLSGGQKQRLAIARAIATNPSILFADEPTGNLDSVTGEKIQDLLFTFNKKLGCTLVIVTHDEELAAKCDAQIYMKDGTIIDTARTKSSPKPRKKVSA